MSNRKGSTNRKVTVTRTKLPHAPWEEDRYIYDIKTGNDSIWSDNAFVVIIQIVFAIISMMMIYNYLTPSDSNITSEEEQLIQQQYDNAPTPPGADASKYEWMDKK